MAAGRTALRRVIATWANARIIETLTYSSEAAFRRLFKRAVGLCSGQMGSDPDERVLNRSMRRGGMPNS
jgi:hypothetical protein